MYLQNRHWSLPCSVLWLSLTLSVTGPLRRLRVRPEPSLKHPCLIAQTVGHCRLLPASCWTHCGSHHSFILVHSFNRFTHLFAVGSFMAIATVLFIICRSHCSCYSVGATAPTALFIISLVLGCCIHCNLRCCCLHSCSNRSKPHAPTRIVVVAALGTPVL